MNKYDEAFINGYMNALYILEQELDTYDKIESLLEAKMPENRKKALRQALDAASKNGASKETLRMMARAGVAIGHGNKYIKSTRKALAKPMAYAKDKKNRTEVNKAINGVADYYAPRRTGEDDDDKNTKSLYSSNSISSKYRPNASYFTDKNDVKSFNQKDLDENSKDSERLIKWGYGKAVASKYKDKESAINKLRQGKVKELGKRIAAKGISAGHKLLKKFNKKQKDEFKKDIESNKNKNDGTNKISKDTWDREVAVAGSKAWAHRVKEENKEKNPYLKS